jgi:alpha-tubulin suppressor-like RCC1 family protein
MKPSAVHFGALARRVSTIVVATCVSALCAATAVAAHAEQGEYVATAWGSNWSGQLGVGSELGPERCSVYQIPCATKAVQVSGLSKLYAIAGGEEHSLSVQEGGAIRAWGSNESDQLGDGRSFGEQLEIDAPIGVCAPNNCASGMGGFSVAAGGQHSLALGGTGTAWAWGSDESGQLGDGSHGAESDRVTPVHVPLPQNAAQIAAGEEHSVALLTPSGNVMTWGNDEYGQLGAGDKGSFADQPNFVVFGRNPIEYVGGMTDIAAGANHSIGLIPGVGVVAWGSNNHGQLGDYIDSGPQTCELGPCSKVAVWVAGARKAPVVDLAAGGDHNLALLEDHTVVAWGANEFGQLGDGTTGDKFEMVPVKGLSNDVVAIAAGEDHSLALLSDGTVMAWGSNAEGQLGNGNSTGPETCGPTAQPCSTTPVPVSGLRWMDVKEIAAGGQHSLAFGPPNPTVTAVSPNHGLSAGGSLVTITGTELNGATAVKFGSANALAYKVESATSITAVSPKGEGTVDVTVTTPYGTSPTSSADLFAYSLTGSAVPEPPPASSSGAPTSPARPAAAASSALAAPSATPRIIGVNVFEGDGEGPKWPEILKGSVNSVRTETAFLAKFWSKKTIPGKRFENMTVIVGNGTASPPSLQPWRTGEHSPSLETAMQSIGGTEAAGISKWAYNTAEEVKQCAELPLGSVAVIEVLNEPQYLEGGDANGPVYGRMLAALLTEVHKREEAGMRHLPLLASANWEENHEGHWLKGILGEGGSAVQKYLGGFVLHPYGPEPTSARRINNMKDQVEYLAKEKLVERPVVYVTEYGETMKGGGVAHQAEETDKIFRTLRGFEWVKGIWYYTFVNKKWGWYGKNAAKAKARPVKGVVECFAREEKEETTGC